MTDRNQTYRLISVKGVRTITGDLSDAVRGAIEMEGDLRPSYGVTIEDERGETVAEIRDGHDILDGED